MARTQKQELRCNLRRAGGPVVPERGFTIIELMVVIVVIGLLASIAIANFVSFQSRAKFASCKSNQRTIVEGAVLFIAETAPGTITLNVNDLSAAGWLPQSVGECPSSDIDDFADYDVEIVNNDINDLGCLVEPVEHLWAVP
ncbi:MAG: type II secretion system protein [Candidatus Krumholzibacteriia bacterium]